MEPQQPISPAEISVPLKKSLWHKPINFVYAALIITLVAAGFTWYITVRSQSVASSQDIQERILQTQNVPAVSLDIQQFSVNLDTDKNLVLTDSNTKRTVTVYDNQKIHISNADKISDAKILLASKRGSFTYLVLDVSGPSRGESEYDGYCGGGTESNLVYVQLSSVWQIVNTNSILYGSCADTIEGGIESQTANTVIMDVINYSSNTHYTISYDADKPEKGFQKQNLGTAEAAN